MNQESRDLSRVRFKDDNTRVNLRMFEGGYVVYRHYVWHTVMMPGEAFDVIYNACR